MYRPWLDRLTGIEMEVNTQTIAGTHINAHNIRRVLRQALVDAGVPSDRVNDRHIDYYHSDGNTWDIKTDSSCGYEIASPALAFDAGCHNEELHTACDALTTIAPQIDGRCGLHVHVDCRDYQWQHIQTVLRLWLLYEPFFYDCCPPTRAHNNYCAPMRQSRWSGLGGRSQAWHFADAACRAHTQQQFQDAVGVLNRYHALNLTPWTDGQGRLEFRLAAGTVSYEKIRRWAMLLLAVVGRATAPHLGDVRYVVRESAAVAPTRYVMRVLGLVGRDAAPEGAALERWVTHRRSKFNPLAAPIRWTPLPPHAAV